MTLDDWLETAFANAEQRGLSKLQPLLRKLGHATAALRSAERAVNDGVGSLTLRVSARSGPTRNPAEGYDHP